MASKFDIYETITQNMINALKEDRIPWQKSWSGGSSFLPQNFVTKKAYNGINMLLLSMLDYQSPYFLTFNQAKEKGGVVKKGEKGHMVVFWKWLDAADKETGEHKSIPFLRYFTVFNVEQIEGLKLPAVESVKENTFKTITEAEAVVAGYKNAPKLIHKEARAYYRPSDDLVNMPEKDTFESPEAYYATLFHELAHSTGHKSRLNRDITNVFADHLYSKEELVAEMTSAFICARIGIDNTSLIQNRKAYIQSWTDVLSTNPKWIVEASSKAKKAADLILNETYQVAEQAA